MFFQENDKLIFRYDDHTLWVEAWGPHAFRVRATKLSGMPDEPWALLSKPSTAQPEISIPKEPTGTATITNGRVRATITHRGKLTIHNTQSNKLLLEEYARHRLDLTDPKCSALEIEARELRGIMGSSTSFNATLRLESLDPKEKIYGMGQYQQPYLDLKGTDVEMAQRNSQASVPFMYSSLDYGLLWNNPAVGRAVLGKNMMSWEAHSTSSIDYWFVAGDGSGPKEILKLYADATGHAPMMPEYGLGFWQCKLRYWNQEELLEVARGYKTRNVPLDVIVVDFFHWKWQGDWSFDEKYFPDPSAMVKELKEMGVELMVSIWPTVDPQSSNWNEMVEKGLLIRHDRGVRVAMQCDGDTTNFDATNPEARKFIWEKAKQNYYAHGIKIFWLDEAEPEYTRYDFDLYRYHRGSNLSVGNIYPRDYAQAFYDGMAASGQTNIVNLLRCAWAGSQRYGALVWSGDVASSWSSFRSQLAAGLNMGMAGIPWWTTDIGGFHGGNPSDPAFRELFVRWFQWGTFCPVMRLHGDREPKPEGQPTAPGAPNEIWSYGPEIEAICRRYIAIRERLRPYTRQLMKDASERGLPVMRTLFMEFPDDEMAWERETQYMFGDKYLVVPVLEAEQRSVKVWLPRGASWKLFEVAGDAGTDQRKTWDGSFEVEVDCPIESMPVFERVG